MLLVWQTGAIIGSAPAAGKGGYKCCDRSNSDRHLLEQPLTGLTGLVVKQLVGVLFTPCPARCSSDQISPAHLMSGSGPSRTVRLSEQYVRSFTGGSSP